MKLPAEDAARFKRNARSRRRREQALTLGLGITLGLQTFAMTMLNPFVNLYGMTLAGGTVFLCSVALAAFGLTNAALQIFSGHLGDRLGRKPVLLGALALLAVGMVMGYFAKSIWGLIAARAVQGCATISALAYSWLGSDIENERIGTASGRAGVLVAAGSVVAYAGGPLLYGSVGAKGLFLISAVAVAAAFVMVAFLPEDRSRLSGGARGEKLGPKLARAARVPGVKAVCVLALANCAFNVEVFNFVPLRVDSLVGADGMWMVFLPSIALGVVGMLVSSKLTDSHGFAPVAVFSFACIFASYLAFLIPGMPGAVLGTTLNMVGYCCVTAGVPAHMSRIVGADVLGTANGLVQTFLAFGAFAGPMLSALLLACGSEVVMDIVSAALALACLVLATRLLRGAPASKPST